MGGEPVTYALEVRCSIQLSYGSLFSKLRRPGHDGLKSHAVSRSGSLGALGDGVKVAGVFAIRES